MKMTIFTRKNVWRISIATICLLCTYLPASAQSVTISPTTGKLIAAVTGSGEIGFANGFSSLWRHDQLPLSVTVSDDADLTDRGQLAKHAGNLKYYNNKIVTACTGTGYFCFSLPRGYRFTGYKIVMQNDIEDGVHKDLESTGQSHNNEWFFSETNSLFSTNKQSVSLGSDVSTNEYSIQRTSTSKADMGNMLYFMFKGNTDSSVAFLTFKSIEITFAPDDDFTVPVAPTTLSATGQSYIYAPFNTDKMDIGVISPNTKDNINYIYSYNYANVKDLSANNVLYEQDCVSDAGTVGSAAGNNSITSVKLNNKLYYGLQSHTYYVETPTTVKEAGEKELPLGYRITGAKINYAYGATTAPNGFYISYRYYSWGWKTNYLGTDGTFGNEKVVWHQDPEGYLYTGTGTGKTYLGYYSKESESWGETYTAYYLATSTKKTAGNIFSITSGKNISTQIDGTTYYINNSKELSAENHAASATDGPTKTFPASTYTLKVYDTTTGNTVTNTISVGSDNASGSVTLTDLNNDAVKFSIEDLADGASAPVTVDLTLEPLNPYIQSMNIVCNGDGGSLAQQFTAGDFKIGGDNFTFYVPSDGSYSFTFEDLKSKYADNTYGPLSSDGNSRYSFVNSDYYTAVGENIYGHKDIVANYDYTKKVYVDVAGDKAFIFNNAGDLANVGGSTKPSNYLIENPFSLAAYKADPNNGTFDKVTLSTSNTEYTKRFIFTTDETRYNIAPTTATQHSYYAYYEINMKAEKKTYTPKITWVPIYNQTLFYDKETGNDATDATVGAIITTVEEGEGGSPKAEDIQQAMETSIKSKEAGAPTKLRDVLYVDASKLRSIVYKKASTKDGITTPDGLSQFKSTLGDNALIYLPTNTTYEGNNFAYRLASGGFHSCSNIIITDKQPFFAPYDIQVDADNYAFYTRQFTTDYNGKVQNATLILPFTMVIDNNGTHTNKNDQCQLTFYQLQKDNCLTAKSEEITGHEGLDFQTDAHFTAVTNGTTTEANKPYHVVAANYVTAADSKTSFTAVQYGSNIVKSPLPDNYIITGETATGSVTMNGTTATYTFTNEGSYSGQKVAKAGDNVFYFAKDHYYSLKNLKGAYLYSYPFRSYYGYPTPAGANGLSVMGVSFDENTTGIEDIPSTQSTNLNITTTQGALCIKANTDAAVAVNNISGQSIRRAELKSGESLNIAVPTGIYIVNGVKVLVK